MRAARWLVIGTAIGAAAAAFHLLMSPTSGRRSVSRQMPVSGIPGSRLDQGASPAVPSPSGPPQDEIDAESREAMRRFLREAAPDGEDRD